MHSYLPTITAEYTAKTLDIDCQSVLPIAGEKFQTAYQTDGGDIKVVTTNTRNWFMVEVRWDVISEADADKIFDLWNDPAQANGIQKTFYWKHPTDTKTYVARFMSDVKVQHFSHYKTISGVKLRIEGVKA